MSLARTFFRRDWIMAVGLPLMGWIAGSKGRLFDTFNIDAVLFFGIVVSLLCYARMVNDYYDALIEGERNALSEEQDVSHRQTLLLVSIPLLPAIILLVVADIAFAAKALSVFFLITVWAYSSPPLRIRNKKNLGTFGNVVLALSIFSAAYFVNGCLDTNWAIVFNAVGVAFFINELVHQLDHAEKDKACGRTTVANRFGLKKTVKLIYAAFGYHVLISAALLLVSHGLEQFILVAITLAVNTMRFLVVRKFSEQTELTKIRNHLYNREEVLAYCVYWISADALF